MSVEDDINGLNLKLGILASQHEETRRQVAAHDEEMRGLVSSLGKIESQLSYQVASKDDVRIAVKEGFEDFIRSLKLNPELVKALNVSQTAGGAAGAGAVQAKARATVQLGTVKAVFLFLGVFITAFFGYLAAAQANQPQPVTAPVTISSPAPTVQSIGRPPH